ncbi:hypothetical protein C2I18_25525 [Paenibacillus sp. PK3_47]|uniref:hypothetical protein n=1 Tax=Paenibacillus sp. PK3_47 TaxID=2072642 RepID=UPI00201DCB0D|nr:hypothetical protein [Paenibacillus sp. PK3_47]UQZ36602.1 hypothetical protein C2I18_25525 [Paenibacillus sp. PK3_47]
MKPRMSPYISTTIRLWAASIVEWLFFIPAWLVLQTYFESGNPVIPWMYTLPLLSLAGVLLRHYCNRRWKQFPVSLLAGAAAGMLTAGWSLYAIPLIAANCTAVFMGLTISSRSNRFRLFLTGLGLYLAAAIAFQRIPLLEPHLGFITWTGSLCLVLMLLDTNTSYLRYSSYAGETARLPAGIQRLNRMYVIGFIAAAAALAAGGAKIIAALFVGVLGAILKFFSLLSGLFTQEEVSPAPAPQAGIQEMLASEVKEPGILALIFDILLYVIGGAAGIAILYFLLRWLYRNSGGLFRRAVDKLLAMLRRETLTETSPYRDEEQSIFTWEKTIQDFRNYWKDRIPGKRRDRWESMNGERERARWLYRQWLNARRTEGYEAKGYLTPRETGKDVAQWSGSRAKQRKGSIGAGAESEELLRLYNQARYGGEEPGSGEIIQLKDKMKF